AHESGFLFPGFESPQIVQPPNRAILYQPADFQTPDIGVHAGIDHVFGDAIKQLVRRNRLDDAALVLETVVTECRGAIEFARQRHSASSHSQSNRAEHKRAAADHWRKLSLARRSFLQREESKAPN